MLTKDAILNVIHNPDFTNRDQLLICLAVDFKDPKSVQEIRRIAVDSGVMQAKKWNISQYLASAKGLAARTSEGWILITSGKEHIYSIAGKHIESHNAEVSEQLRETLTNIADPVVRNFVIEAVKCYENELYRAAVVLSWVGAIGLLYEYVLQNHLGAFNAEARRRSAKWKTARTKDDLARMRECDFLDILDAISVIGKSIKQELNVCLHLGMVVDILIIFK